VKKLTIAIAACALTLALGMNAVPAASTGPASGAAISDVPGYIAIAAADPSRPADDRKLDADRKPAEVLTYAGIRPGQIIGEYLPGGGYYTRLLSNIVGPNGKVYALETTTWGDDNVNSTKQVLSEPGRGNVTLDLTPLGTFHLPEKVDLFWTTLNYHDLHITRYANVDMASFNNLVFASLKPGGIYFIVDHAAAPGTRATLSPTLHRIEKTTVIQEVTAAGFKLVGQSDLLRNPTDDHTKKVFDLRFKTDQFILKFRRP
jgi:predicted methyltransferase